MKWFRSTIMILNIMIWYNGEMVEPLLVSFFIGGYMVPTSYDSRFHFDIMIKWRCININPVYNSRTELCTGPFKRLRFQKVAQIIPCPVFGLLELYHVYKECTF